jgi:5-methylcytosine-specific restriction endonuclease McrA
MFTLSLLCKKNASHIQKSGYLCYYCDEKFDLFKDIFNHLIEKHNAETFKIKKLKFSEKEGVLGYTNAIKNQSYMHMASSPSTLFTFCLKCKSNQV